MKIKVTGGLINFEFDIPLRKERRTIKGIELTPEMYAHYEAFLLAEEAMYEALNKWTSENLSGHVGFMTAANKALYEGLYSRVKEIFSEKFPKEYQIIFGN